MVSPSKETLNILYLSVVMFTIGSVSIGYLTYQAIQHPKQKKFHGINALTLAKNALLSQADNLPCPDDNNDGISDTLKEKCLSTIGWLPFKTLGLKDLRDNHNERLWYAYSPNHTLTVNGQGNAKAVIIAPHQELNGQEKRPSANTPQPNGAKKMLSLYLEGANANQNFQEFSNLGPIVFNDQLVWLTSQELRLP